MGSPKYVTVGKSMDDDEEDDVYEVDLQSPINSFSDSDTTGQQGGNNEAYERGSCTSVSGTFSTLTFSWIKPLLELGNSRQLEQSDLYDLSIHDSAAGVYKAFRSVWAKQLRTDSPSLGWGFVSAFGGPFMAAGFLKLVHDSCLFVGPHMLNSIILYLNDTSQPTSVGLMYVLGLFLANFTMSLCLRQYFWWCYKVGMRLRSSVITSVFAKTLILSAGALSTHTSGQITNLLTIDASRMQALTPYLHAIWYSFFQIAVAMYFLWQQVGYAALSGITVILLTIPLTSKISGYLKASQSKLAVVRDERVKMSNEVLMGMKIIKIQAWEEEFEKRLLEVRERELLLFREYMIMQSLSGALYTTIPLVVGISTFATYIALGNDLTVATALTSLALFDILRFPLFMLPNVLNNVIEAKVSLDRLQKYLLESERMAVPTSLIADKPTKHGFSDKDQDKEPMVSMDKATFIWESLRQTYPNPDFEKERYEQEEEHWMNVERPITVHNFGSLRSLIFQQLSRMARWCASQISVYADCCCVAYGQMYANCCPSTPSMFSGFSLSSSSSSSGASASSTNSNSKKGNMTGMSTSQFDARIAHDIISESEKRIELLERQISLQKRQGSSNFNGFNDEKSASSSLMGESEDEGEGLLSRESNGIEMSTYNANPLHGEVSELPRFLSLSRVSLTAKKGELVAIVGAVGSGKSSVLSSLLGELRICYGALAMKGKVAYVPQVPFIQNATVKDNILFGEVFDQAKYDRAVEMCALTTDMKVLPFGDQTEIGERGINLSGGQKARVSLARAVYSEADVYLLDDPLSAVDAHVGAHIYHQCIRNLQLNQKCVILVTNALQYVKTSDVIIVLKDGQMAETGSYSSLMAFHPDSHVAINDHTSTVNGTFALMMKGYNEQHQVDGDDRASGGVEGSVVLSSDPSEDGSTSAGLKHRSTSVDSTASNKDKKDVKSSPPTANNLISAEEREVGQVDSKVYWKWCKAAGGMQVGLLMIGLYLAGESCNVCAQWWLSYWSQHAPNNSDGASVSHSTRSPWFYLSIYILINIIFASVSLGRELYTRFRAWDAGKQLYEELLGAVLYAPMSFFDTTPLGRIINRFSKDVYTVDEQLSATIRMYVRCMMSVAGVLIYISIVLPLFMVALLPIGLFYFVSQRYYIRTSRELTRLESTSRSPIYALFSETLDGLSTIRAYKVENRYTARNNSLVDANQKAYFLNFSANCWLAVRLELAGTLIVSFGALFAVLSRNNLDTESAVQDREAFAGLAGLAISLSLSITQSLNWSVRMASDLESQMVSVERIKGYSVMDQEPPHQLPTDKELRPTGSNKSSDFDDFDSVSGLEGLQMTASKSNHWPTKGEIEWRKVVMAYRPGLPHVLKGLTFSIDSCMKVGVVGRTGAGKSSLVTALLRLVELESGSILIDGVDISTVGLQTLRSSVAVIPQDPVLFSGTVRSNLDPFQLFTDGQCWEGLKRVRLEKTVNTLDDTVAENGSNYSVGQRQLLCIARALLQKAKIIIMDEASAAMDSETDALLQKTIRIEFAHATTITIAHRLNTIMDSNKVLVMDDGVVKEYDTPAALLAQEDSIFAGLVAHWDDEEENK